MKKITRKLPVIAVCLAAAGAFAHEQPEDKFSDVYAADRIIETCNVIGTCNNESVYTCKDSFDFPLMEYHVGTGTCHTFALGQFTPFE